MTKYIKRAGIVFFAIVLSLLLFIGIILTLNATNSNEDYSDLENDDIQTVANVSYALSGDTYEKANTWSTAINYSVNNNVQVDVILTSDWTTEYDRNLYVNIFGFGSGFTANGGISVPAGANIRLNLNGYSLDGSSRSMIDFMQVYGQLTISYNPSETKDYRREISTGNVTGSKLTGASMNGNPLIKVSGSSARFYFNGGYITGNSVGVSGSTNYGFISVENGAYCALNGGGICNNSVLGNISSSRVYAAVKGSCHIEDIVIIEDNANMSGICVESGSVYLGDWGNGYIYGSNKYDIYLDDNSKIEFLDNKESGTYGVSATPGRFFTLRYGSSLHSRNPMVHFKFKNPSISEHYAFIDEGVGEVKFVPKSQMTLLTKPTRGSSSNYIKEYESAYYPIGYDSTTMTISGNTSYSIGNHKATVQPKNGCMWKDSLYVEALAFEWQLVPKKLVKPTLGTSTFVYDGQSKSPTLQNFNTSLMTKSGTYSGISVGARIITIRLKNTNNYTWSDGTTKPINLAWNITEKPIEKPVTGNNVYVFNNSAYEYVPEGFESSQMTISDNIQTNVGKYTAKVKPNSNHKWSDDTKTELEFDYKIIPPGIVVEDNLNWDYLYLQNNFRKSYSANNYYHKVNDEDIVNVSGNIRYVLGNIVTGTKISTFLGNIRNDIKLIKIYNQYDNIIYDGIASNGEIAESVGKQLIATGYRVELYENATETTAFDTVYLSVLGDLNGDGRITAMDLLVINQMAKDESLLDSMEIEYQLAAMVNNKGGITSVDSEILNNVMSGELDLNLFINSEINENTNYTYLILNKENGKYERVVSETATNVIGNITIGTKVSEFKAKLATLGVNTAQIAIYNNQDTQVTDDNAVVGTGWYYEINGSQRTYISVLGDLNGDGRISASDMMYLNQIINGDKESFEDCIILSAIILNTGKITSADVEVLRDNIENFTALIAY